MKTTRLFNLSALSRISYTLGAGFLIAALALSFFPQPQAAIAGSGAIWTTRSGCGSPEQDVNHFDIGDHIYINGSGFDGTTTYSWSIKGKPGGASCDPGIQVAGSSYQTDGSGAFCFSAYTVHADDCGEYQVKFGTKGDNYQVDGVPTNTPVPPTATDTSEPTATDTPEPTATDTPEPTATDTPEPTATDTPEPTATDTPEPTATDTPEPTATDTPEPTATDTPEPTATPTESNETPTPGPSPTPSDTPEPTATDTPEPTATDTPEPTATDTPEPTATDTPEPTATDTPEPTATATISVETPTQEPTDPPADPTNTPAPTNPPDPTATPVDQILIPVTGADLNGGPSSPISSAGALGLSVAFLGLGLILQGYKRMQTES